MPRNEEGPGDVLIVKLPRDFNFFSNFHER